jgi:hypothetical protein
MQWYQVYRVIILKRQFHFVYNETYLSISLHSRRESIVGILFGDNGYYS